MAGSLELKVVRLHRLEGETRTKAFVDLAIGDFVVKGFRILQGNNGLYLGMPQEKSKDGIWYNVFYASTPEARQCLADAVLAAYQE